MYALPGPEDSRREPLVAGRGCGIFYWPSEVTSGQLALLLSEQLRTPDDERPQLGALQLTSDGRDTPKFDALMLFLPCEPCSDLAQKIETLTRVLTTYRSRRAQGRPTDTRRRTGVVVVAGPAALLGAGPVVLNLPGVDHWLDVQDIGRTNYVWGSSSPVAVGTPTHEAPWSVDGDQSPSETLQRGAVDDAWSTMRSVGIHTRRDCSKFLQVVDDMEKNFFENPRKTVLYRPLGDDIPKNALGIIIAGLHEQLAFWQGSDKPSLARANKSQRESLARALRDVNNRLVAEIPSYRPPYHFVARFGPTYWAARLIMSNQRGGRSPRQP